MSSNKRIDDFFIRASGQVLTKQLPNHWYALTDDRLEEWLENHACAPPGMTPAVQYEYWSAKNLWDRIVSLSCTLLEVHEESLESVRGNVKGNCEGAPSQNITRMSILENQLDTTRAAYERLQTAHTALHKKHAAN
jgi:hypothetical protein